MTDEITGRCSKCRANTTFSVDPYTGDLASVCCWFPPVDPSVAVDTAEEQP